MSYIEENLAQGERILYIGRFPWVYTANAISFFVFCVLLALACMIAIPVHSDAGFGFVIINSWKDITPVQWYLGAGLFSLGFLRFAYMMLVEQNTEIVVTSLRFLLKRGILSCNVDSVNIDRVEGCDVHQGFFGFLMGYGRVEVRGTGIGEVKIPPVSNPKDLANAVQQAIALREEHLEDQHDRHHEEDPHDDALQND